jgi:HK97 family phage portal protein
MYKVQAISSTRLRAYQGDPIHPTLALKHPLSALLARPNPQQSAPEFEGLNTVYLNLGGNAFIYLDRGAKEVGRPVAMYPLRPDRVRLVPDTRGIKGFLYVPPGKSENDTIPYLADDVIHIKFPNPDDPFEGMGYGQSPLTASGQSGDVDNQLTAFLKLFLERGAMPAGLLKFSISMKDEQVANTRRRWMERYGGVNNWASVGVLDQGGDYKPLGHSFKEMGFSDIDERNETRILMSLGVPGILLNSRSGLKNSTYSNIQEAREAFWDDRMRFEMGLFDEEYSHFLNEDGVFVQRDLSQVPALQKRILSQAQAARAMWDMGVPANTAFGAVGLRVGEIPDGDQPFGGRSSQSSTPDAVLAAAEKRLAKTPTTTDDQDEDEADTEENTDAEKGVQRSGLQRLPTAAQRKGFDEQKKASSGKPLTTSLHHTKRRLETQPLTALRRTSAVCWPSSKTMLKPPSTPKPPLIG